MGFIEFLGEIYTDGVTMFSFVLLNLSISLIDLAFSFFYLLNFSVFSLTSLYFISIF